MHIPSGQTIEMDILHFNEARQVSRPDREYDRQRWLYIPDFYSEYRYLLGTRGAHPLIAVGINPSTAEPDHLDNTLKSVSRIAEGNGYDSWIMFNVYAQRATNPDQMDHVFNADLHRENMLAFRWILDQCAQPPGIWAAWGAIIEKRGYLKSCVSDMAQIAQEYSAKWYRAGRLSIKGHPHHPLYLKKDSQLERFDIKAYIEES